MKKLYLFGGGPHCNSCLEIINQRNTYKIIRIVEQNIKESKIDKSLYEVINQNDIKKNKKNMEAHISIGNYRLIKKRKKIFEELINKNFIIPTITSKNSIISKNSKIGNGTIVMNGAIINSNVTIGKNCIINTGSIIEHDVRIGNHCIISPGAIINGNVKIGELSFIGAGSVIVNDLIIPKNSFIKANELVKK